MRSLFLLAFVLLVYNVQAQTPEKIATKPQDAQIPEVLKNRLNNFRIQLPSLKPELVQIWLKRKKRKWLF